MMLNESYRNCKSSLKKHGTGTYKNLKKNVLHFYKKFKKEIQIDCTISQEDFLEQFTESIQQASKDMFVIKETNRNDYSYLLEAQQKRECIYNCMLQVQEQRNK